MSKQTRPISAVRWTRSFQGEERHSASSRLAWVADGHVAGRLSGAEIDRVRRTVPQGDCGISVRRSQSREWSASGCRVTAGRSKAWVPGGRGWLGRAGFSGGVGGSAGLDCPGGWLSQWPGSPRGGVVGAGALLGSAVARDTGCCGCVDDGASAGRRLRSARQRGRRAMARLVR